MTVLTTDNRRSYTGDGSTTVFAFPVFFLEDADVKVAVRVNDVEGTPIFNTDYTVSGAGNPSGGTVTFTVAPVSGATVVIFNDPALTQTVDYQDNDEFPAETHERALDKLTLVCQRITARLSRMLQYDETAPEVLSASDLIGRVTAAETARDQAQAAQSGAETAETNAAASAASASAAASSAATDAAAGVTTQLSGFVTDAQSARDAAATSATEAAASAASVDGPTLRADIDALQAATNFAAFPSNFVSAAAQTIGSAVKAWTKAYLSAIEGVGTNTTIKRVGGTNTTAIVDGLAKILGNLNGTGTIAFRDSIGLSSATDNGTGDYTFNFTHHMSNADYFPQVVGDSDFVNVSGLGPVQFDGAPTASSLRVQCASSTPAVLDYVIVSLVILGTLA